MFVFSLGCGIGYGYLHRIPATPEMSTDKPPIPVAEEKSSPQEPTHGYTEVNVNIYIYDNSYDFFFCVWDNILQWFCSCDATCS